MVLIISVLGTALAVVLLQRTITHQVSILGIADMGIYKDEACTQVIDAIDWGALDASAGNVPVYTKLWMKNLGNIAVNVTWDATGLSWDGSWYYKDTGNGKTVYIRLCEGSWTDAKTVFKPLPYTGTAFTTYRVIAPNEVVQLEFLAYAEQGCMAVAISFTTTFYANE